MAEGLRRAGASESSTASSETGTSFVCYIEELSYQLCLAALLATIRHHKAVRTVLDVAFAFPDEDWIEL